MTERFPINSASMRRRREQRI